MELLTRNEFRAKVFERDNNKCVVCGDSLDIVAHHIMERRLFPDSGFYVDNGTTLCPKCHIKAEQTILNCEEIREAASIKIVVLPPHLYTEYRYEKWGNIILPDGRRLKGELFFDISVQRILKSGGVLDQFCKYVKHPRIWHLPFSDLVTKDDRILDSVSYFEGKRVIVTEKLDGEQFSLYNDYIHARSIDGQNHPSYNWLKNFHSKMAYNIPEEWRVCGENMYAKHTIYYDNLKTYFYVFSIWNEKNECLSWNDTILWTKLLDLELVPVLYDGIWDVDKIKELCKNDEREGFVVRLYDSFSYGDFYKSIAKYVNPLFRKKLIEEDTFHWRYGKITPNKLRKK